MSTFVTVGNATQAFDRLLAAVRDLSASLPHPIVVQRGVSRLDHPGWQTVDFVPMEEFERLVRESSVLIMHAGAGSIIHAARSGRRPVVMPRRMHLGEHVDDHQLEFAEALAKAGYVHLATDVTSLTAGITAPADNSIKPPRPAEPPLIACISSLLRQWDRGTESR